MWFPIHTNLLQIVTKLERYISIHQALWLKGSGELSNYLEKGAHADTRPLVGTAARPAHRDVLFSLRSHLKKV